MFYEQQDALYLTNYRAYDPRDARWLSRDPLRELAGLNLYSYASGSPINATDPKGNIALVDNIIGGLVAVAFDYAIHRATCQGYGAGDFLLDFGLGFATDGLSALKNLGTASKAARIAEKEAPTVLAQLQAHVDSAIARFNAEGFTERQAAALESNPNLEAAFTGERIDTFFKESVLSDPDLSYLQVTPRFAFGPDVFDPVSNTWWDVTTEGQWAAHEAKYNDFFGLGTGLFYNLE
jgi:RHS repeat-associated protein